MSRARTLLLSISLLNLPWKVEISLLATQHRTTTCGRSMSGDAAPAIKVGIIGGSGLDDPDILEGRREEVVTTPFGCPSDVLIHGRMSGVACVLLARHGRTHSINPSNVNYRANIWALKQAGCQVVLASTATGSLQAHIKPGQLVLLDSFIDRTRSRIQTFYDGSENSPKGVCHIQMDAPFSKTVRSILQDGCDQLGLEYKPHGTCVVIEGPRFSSRAESKMYQSWGGDVINMTTVPEVVLAKEAGLHYAAVAMATDYDCWREEGERVSAMGVVETFKKNAHNVTRLFQHVVPKIANKDWTKDIKELREAVESSVMSH